MDDGNALINLGELSKPATVLVEKISDAIGGIFRPYQIRRVAQAEAAAEKVRAVSQIEINTLQRRALHRFLTEEAKKQSNIEAITQKALPQVQEAASPQNVEDDWISNFFDKCRLISDGEMQILWSRILAGEANSPGVYSKRTVNLLASLDKNDAELFRNLCSFAWMIGNITPLIYEPAHSIYNEAGINFNSLMHLDAIGLISFEVIAGYQRTQLPKKVVVFYYGRPVEVEFPQPDGSTFLQLGSVLLSKAGQELATICGSVPRPGFENYVLDKWRSFGLSTTGSIS